MSCPSFQVSFSAWVLEVSLLCWVEFSKDSACLSKSKFKFMELMYPHSGSLNFCHGFLITFA